MADVKKIEEIAQVTFLDYESPAYVGFGGRKTEWECTFTFLDLLEMGAWLQVLDAGVKFGPESAVITAKGKGFKWNDGSLWNLAEWVANLAFDAFTGTDNTALPSHTMDKGSGWLAMAGYSNARILGNQAAPSGDSSQNVTDVGASDATVRAQLTHTQGEWYPGFVLRSTDDSHYWFIDYEPDQTWHLIEANAWSTVAQSAAMVLTTGTHSIEIQFSGTTVRLTVDGTLVLTYASATLYQSGTRFGFWLGNSGCPSGRIDDFWVLSP